MSRPAWCAVLCLAGLLVGQLSAATSNQWSGTSGGCFAASKAFTARSIDPAKSVADFPVSWSVSARTFEACVVRSKEADHSLKMKYPDTRYHLVLTTTIGCHKAC